MAKIAYPAFIEECRLVKGSGVEKLQLVFCVFLIVWTYSERVMYVQFTPCVYVRSIYALCLRKFNLRSVSTETWPSSQHHNGFMETAKSIIEKRSVTLYSWQE